MFEDGNLSGTAFFFGASWQRGGERKPVSVIINDQLEASIPAGSLMIESPVVVIDHSALVGVRFA